MALEGLKGHWRAWAHSCQELPRHWRRIAMALEGLKGHWRAWAHRRTCAGEAPEMRRLGAGLTYLSRG